nr:ribonuclease H-like domain-containing protein [Tanacetum cinerariifolium]
MGCWVKGIGTVQVLDLQEVKAAQAKEIATLKKKVSKLNKWRKSRSGGLRRLKRFGSCRRVKSPMEKDGLGAKEGASKQERMIEEIDQNAKTALDDETQEMINNDEMFGVDDLAGEEVVMDSDVEPVTVVKGSAALTTDVTEDEITVAQALAALKSVKPKVVSQIPTVSSLKDKGKTKMIEPEVPLKKKDQMRINEELLAEKFQAREREEFSEVQKTRLYKQSHLKGRSFNEIKELFDKEMRKVNDFVAMDSEAQKSSAKEAQESSTKRTTEHLESDISKKQKVDENVEPVVDDSEELRKCIYEVFGYILLMKTKNLIKKLEDLEDEYLVYSRIVGIKSLQRVTVIQSSEKESKNVSEDIPNELKEYLDAPLVKDIVSDNKDFSVKSLVVVEKKTNVPFIAKVKCVRPKQQEKPVRHAQMYMSQGLRGSQRNWNNLKSQQLGRKGWPRAVNTASPRAVNTARPRAINTARPNSAVVNAVRENKGHPQKVKEDQGYVDSGCSRHMTGNMSYLSEFKEFNRGYVTFGEGANSGRIIGKGTLKTGKLDFKDVYFVKELKFNLLSVLQMCDKKNDVLFTDSRCFVLSPDFKLVDESRILLKVPKKNNMYSVDMKNIVPKEILTCLVAKATLEESMLWHRRLGHINFIDINKLIKDNLREQNGVFERRNRTLIEAAKTMLADSKLPTTLWAEAVNTACYVHNRVLVVKPHNKTPYELFRGRTHALSFIRPFRCHVTILNTFDHLGKFDGKADEGYFIGYSMNIIMNGDEPAAIALVSSGVEAAVPPKTIIEKIARINELKAKSNLLLAIPDEHLLKFHGINDAKTLCEAIKTSLQLDNEDLEQIDTDDFEEMDLKWQSDQAKEGPINFALMAFSSSGLSISDIKNEAGFEEEVAFLKYDVKVRDNSTTELKNKLEKSLKEKDDLKLKLEKIETSSRNLTNLLNSQLSSKDMTGLGYDSQLNERDLSNKSDVFESASDSSVNESEEDNN